MQIVAQHDRFTLTIFTFTFLFTLAVQARSQPQCMPAFPQQTGIRNGWVGADTAFSLRLPQQRDLWIFGDTLLGPQRALREGEPAMIRNSLGVSRCESGTKWSMRYVIPQNASGAAHSVFVPSDPSHWYWPMDGFLFNHRLWIVLLCLRQPHPLRPGAFNFESCGVDLASLPLSADPGSLQATVRPLTAANAGASMSSTVVRHGGFVYFFGIRESGDRGLLVSRVRLTRLREAAHQLEFLAKDGHWRRDTSPQQAKVLLQPGATEMSIRYHPRWHRWLAIYKDPDLSSDRVLLRSAATLHGPWSPERTLFSIRPLDPAASRPGIFCYAGKEHPEFATRGQLVVTYVCNSSDPASLLTQHDIYVPQVVRVSVGKTLQVLHVERIAKSTQDRTAPLPDRTVAGPE